jgi:hypothetical protein
MRHRLDVRGGGGGQGNRRVARVDTQIERLAVTEMDGTYVVGGLAPGRYQVKVEEAAYTPFEGPVLALTAGQRALDPAHTGRAVHAADSDLDLHHAILVTRRSEDKTHRPFCL